MKVKEGGMAQLQGLQLNPELVILSMWSFMFSRPKMLVDRLVIRNDPSL